MDKIEILTHKATRQFRHNDDNSPDLFKPEQGFVIAYDREVIDGGLAELKATIKRQQDALEAVGRECENTVTLEGDRLCNADEIMEALAKAEVKS